MATFVFRLKGTRSTFPQDMTDDEREIMARHAAYWHQMVDAGRMVVLGPVADSGGTWGLGVLEGEDEEEIQAFVDADPAVVSGTAIIELGRMLTGFVRPRPD